jgi:hypothetical protein
MESGPHTADITELYGSLDADRLIFQVILFFSIASSVVYSSSLFFLRDDFLNAAPLPKAMVSDWKEWIFVVPIISPMIIAYSQYAFSMNRKSCMRPMYWVVFVIYILIYTASFVYLFYLWLADCRGATDLVADPFLGYCSTGAEVRWQFMFTFWTMFAIWVLLILCTIPLDMIFNIAKRIKPALDRETVKNEPLNTVLTGQQLGRRYHDEVSTIVYTELLKRKY